MKNVKLKVQEVFNKNKSRRAQMTKNWKKIKKKKCKWTIILEQVDVFDVVNSSF
jgi:hypothetical protein